MLKMCLALLFLAIPAGAQTLATASDSVRRSRELRGLVLQSGDAGKAIEALQLSASGPVADRILSLLTLEELVRKRGAIAQADSVFLLNCTRFVCERLTDDVPAIIAALEEELRRVNKYARGPVTDAIRSLVVFELLPDLTMDEQVALGLMQSHFQIPKTADSLAAAGNRKSAAALRYAYGYTLLPERQVRFGGMAHNALDQADTARVLLRGDTSVVLRARVVSLAALAHMRLGNPDSARTHLAEADAMGRSTPTAFRALLRRRRALIEASAGDTAAALRVIAEAVALRGADSSGAAVDRLRLARELTQVGAAGPAIVQARAAYDVLRGVASKEFLGEILTFVGEAHRLRRNADSAAHYFRAAAETYSQLAMDGRAAHLLAAMAEDALELGRLARSDSLVDQATAALTRSAPLMGPPGWATRDGPWSIDEARRRIHNDRGLVLLGRGRVADALALFKLAEGEGHPNTPEFIEARRNATLATSILAPSDSAWRRGYDVMYAASEGHYVNTWLEPPRSPHRRLSDGWIQTTLAQLHFSRGNLAGAYLAARAALDSIETLDDTSSTRRVRAILGSVFAQFGRRDSAAHYFRLAGQRMPAQKAPRTLSELRVLLARNRAADDTLTQAQLLGAIGVYHLRRARPANPALAAAYLDSAIAMFRRVQLTGLPDWFAVQFAEEIGQWQQLSVLAWLARSREIGARAAATASAAAADRGRGFAFDLLAGSDVGFVGGYLSEIWDPFRHDTSLAVVGERLLRPGYFSQRPATLSYLIAADTLIIWYSSPGFDTTTNVRVVRRAITAASLANLISATRAAFGVDSAATRDVRALEPEAFERTRGIKIENTSIAAADAALARVARVILPAGLLDSTETREMVVVAGGALASLPFAALPIGNGTVRLSDRYALRYAPSLVTQAMGYRRGRHASLPRTPSAYDNADSLRLARQAYLKRAIVVGNPAMPTVRGADSVPRKLSPLPGAESEAAGVARLMGVAPVIGGDATVGALRARSEQATIIHLATHGYAYGSEEKVGDSFVALAPENGGRGGRDDGLLTVTELLVGKTLRLPAAELVVLSACQTGLGQMTASEGTLGLQRAFLAAGAGSVLVSLWSVSDQATALLLQSFYRHWLEDTDGPTKAQALQRAQDDLRKDTRFAHPRYWAAFQLVSIE